jgi:hypothetical protein
MIQNIISSSFRMSPEVFEAILGGVGWIFRWVVVHCEAACAGPISYGLRPARFCMFDISSNVSACLISHRWNSNAIFEV